MNFRKIRNYSIAISLAAHFAFLIWSGVYYLPEFRERREPEKSLINVKIVRDTQPLPPKNRREKDKATAPVKIKPDIEPAISHLKEEKILKPEVSTPRPQMSPQVANRSVMPRIKESPLEQLVFHSPTERKTRREIVSRKKVIQENLFSKPQGNYDSRNEADEEFLDKMPGFTPEIVGDWAAPSSPTDDPEAQRKFSPVGVKKQDAADLAGQLVWQLAVYTDPRDKQSYFRISVKSDPQIMKLPPIPKELIILLDSSISIREERLEEFKKGIKYSLNHLNEDDIFNVLAFKEDIARFGVSSVKATPANIQAAMNFVDGLKASQKTDVYQALYSTIKEEHTYDPTYIFLLSDGLPTEGITDSQEVISEIARFNDGRVGIFAFSGGSFFNRYLLDFISYKNRGWTEYAELIGLVSRTMGGMYMKFRDPILLKLRYYVSGLNEREIFPKIMPDLYRNAVFTLYGKFDRENKFVIRLLGNIKNGEVKEFNIEGSFDQAVTGDESIARNWAFNKIYHLIGLLEHDKDNKKIIKEIAELSKKFGISTPYKEVR